MSAFDDNPNNLVALTHMVTPYMAACQRTFVADCDINLKRALKQWQWYCHTLESLGCVVTSADPNMESPDGVFIEDTAIVLDELAILARMGTSARAPEPAGIEPVLRRYRDVRSIDPPATIEGGDVLRVDRTLLVGLSSRTNQAGVDALCAIVSDYGYRALPVPVQGCLHLKTACTALPDGRLFVNTSWFDTKRLAGFDCISIPKSEPWAANTLPIGAKVCLPAAHVETAELIDRLGFEVAPVDISEFGKAEGGVTCLSLVFSNDENRAAACSDAGD